MYVDGSESGMRFPDDEETMDQNQIIIGKMRTA